MLDWIARNHQIITTLTSVGMLFVWIAYLQVFVGSYRRQTRPKILINLGSGSGLDSRCLVSNMSSDAIYIQSIIIELETPDARISCPVTEMDGIEDWQEPSDLNLWTRQGPLQAGQVRDMGSLRPMLNHVLRSQSRSDGDLGSDAWEQLIAFEVKIIAAYGSEDLLVGAKRRFNINHSDGNVVLRPQTIGAEQIRSRRERKSIERMLEEEAGTADTRQET
jgi:hypothetical protein